MEKKTWLKLIVIIFVTVAIATGIYLRWRPAMRGSGPLVGWGTGNLRVSEKAYYRSKISRIIENWQQTAGAAERDKQGRLKESYNTYLVRQVSRQNNVETGLKDWRPGPSIRDIQKHLPHPRQRPRLQNRFLVCKSATLV